MSIENLNILYNFNIFLKKFKKYVISIIILTNFFTSVNAGEKSVPFSLKTLKNKIIPIDSMTNKAPVLITFWALWCSSCKEELQALNRLKNEYPFNQISIVAVNQDSPRSLARVRSYVSTHRFPFIFCIDPNQELLHLLNSWAIPFTVLISKEREIVLRHIGYLSGDEKFLQKEVELYLQNRK